MYSDFGLHASSDLCVHTVERLDSQSKFTAGRTRDDRVVKGFGVCRTRSTHKSHSYSDLYCEQVLRHPPLKTIEEKPLS